MDKILVIDSQDATGELIVKYFSRLGYDVMLLREGLGAQVKVLTMRPDLIVINAELRDESGFDVCKKLKQGARAGHTPIIMMINGDDGNAITRSIEVGADDYMTKTNMDVSVLYSKIKSLLRIKRLNDELKGRYVELEEKNKMIDAQLKMARQVQRLLVHEHNFSLGGAIFYSKYLPALDIGGDYYDVIKTGEHSATVIVGDVSGHGISAALLTAMIHSMAQKLAFASPSPSLFLSGMNEEFNKIFENRGSQMYVCLFCAMFDLKKRTIGYSNAGHVLPIHISGKLKTALELSAVGTPVGMLSNSVYETHTKSYDYGDTFLFYTDGLCDNLYKNEPDEFLNQLKTILLGTRNADSPETVANALIELSGAAEFEDLMKYQLDDASFIICKM